MICITVSREDLLKISNGKEGKIQRKTIPSDNDNIKDLLKIFDIVGFARNCFCLNFTFFAGGDFLKLLTADGDTDHSSSLIISFCVLNIQREWREVTIK